jgi:hypothetical protein
MQQSGQDPSLDDLHTHLTPAQSDEIAKHATRAVRLGKCVALGTQTKADEQKLQTLAESFSKESTSQKTTVTCDLKYVLEQ